MTPAIDFLNNAGVDYTLLEYVHDPHANHSTSYGEEASNALNISPHRVFKTLLVSCDPADPSKKLAVAIVPVSHQLNLKATAKSLKTKKVCMADTTAVQNTTGYILGGISPLGQKKRLATIIDCSASDFDSIFVSGGKRGLEIEIAPQNLIDLVNAKLAEIKN